MGLCCVQSPTLGDCCRVLSATVGAEALELIGRLGPPRLVLTDMMMPGIGGEELAQRLTARWLALPVLLMSGYSAAQFRPPQPKGPMPDLIQKPFTPGELMARVAAALARADAHLTMAQ